MNALARALALVAVLAAPARAGLPCLLDAGGAPLRWAMPVTYHLDPGAAAVDGAALAQAATAAWTGVPTATVAFTPGMLPAPVGLANLADIFGRCGDGLSPLIFDPDGSLTDALVGEGGSLAVLGLTLFDCDTATAPAIPEASVIINGRVFGFAGSDARATQVQVLTHELGHVLNLCHSRLHEAFVDDGDGANDAFVPVMFPSHSEDVAAPDPTPRLDDRVMLSALYPGPGFFAATGILAGHVLSGPSGMPVSAAPVVVRSVTDPLATAQWTTSGWIRVEGPRGLAVPGGEVVAAIDGSWQAHGLPPGSYTVEVEPGIVGSPGEFFSGTMESGDPVADPPELAVPVALGAGETRTDATIRLAERVRSPLGDTDWQVAWRGWIERGGVRERLPAGTIPPGGLALLSTGAYLVTPLSVLGGSWRARGRRGLAQVLDAQQLQQVFGSVGAPFTVTRATGRGRADRRLRRIRGSIVLRAQLLRPRVRFRIRFAYRGTRRPDARVPGRLPLLPAS